MQQDNGKKQGTGQERLRSGTSSTTFPSLSSSPSYGAQASALTAATPSTSSGGGIREILDSLRRRNGYGERELDSSNTSFGTFASTPQHGNVGADSALHARGEVEAAPSGGGVGTTRFAGRDKDERSPSVKKFLGSADEAKLSTSGSGLLLASLPSTSSSSSFSSSSSSIPIAESTKFVGVGTDKLSSLNNGGSRITAHGWMQKRGKVNRSWQTRYFLLWNDSVLYYFENEPDVRAFLRGEDPRDSSRGLIDLQTASAVQKSIENPGVIEILTPTRVWELKPIEGAGGKLELCASSNRDSANHLQLFKSTVATPNWFDRLSGVVENTSKHVIQNETEASSSSLPSPSAARANHYKPNAKSVKRVGWVLKRGDGVFSSYHRRYFVVHANKSLVYFDNLAEVDEFIQAIKNTGEVPSSHKIENRTVDLASIISAKDGLVSNGKTQPRTLVVTSPSKNFTLAEVEGREEPYEVLRKIILGVAGLYKKALGKKLGDKELTERSFNEINHGRMRTETAGLLNLLER